MKEERNKEKQRMISLFRDWFLFTENFSLISHPHPNTVLFLFSSSSFCFSYDSLSLSPFHSLAFSSVKNLSRKSESLVPQPVTFSSEPLLIIIFLLFLHLLSTLSLLPFPLHFHIGIITPWPETFSSLGKYKKYTNHSNQNLDDTITIGFDDDGTPSFSQTKNHGLDRIPRSDFTNNFLHRFVSNLIS